MKLRAVLGLFVLLVSSYSSAFYCSNVTVSDVLMYSDGSVKIKHDGRNDFTQICNLKNDWGDVTITMCAMWTSSLQSAMKNNLKATIYYPGDGTCPTLATYGSSPVPGYIGIQNY